MAMIVAIFLWPLFAGAILLAFGLYHKDRLLRAVRDAFLTVALFLMMYQFYMVADHVSWIEYGLFLDSWSDVIGFAVLCLVAGVLAGDGLAQALLKKSSSS